MSNDLISSVTVKSKDEWEVQSQILSDYILSFLDAEKYRNLISIKNIAATPAEAQSMTLLSCAISMTSTEVAFTLKEREDHKFFIESLLTRDWKTEYGILKQGQEFPIENIPEHVITHKTVDKSIASKKN